MDLPVYFELDGKYAAMLPADDGGVIVAIDPGISIADCMDHGHRISEEKLPDDFLNFMKQ